MRTIFAVTLLGALSWHVSSARAQNVINSPPMPVPQVINAGTEVNVFDGAGFFSTEINGGGVLNVLGDDPGFMLEINPQGTANLAGGVLLSAELFNARLRVAGGVVGRVEQRGLVDSMLTFAGDEFRVNQNLVSGLNQLGDSAVVTLLESDVLSGTLSDGTPFVISDLDNDHLAGRAIELERTATPAIGPSIITASVDPIPRGIRTGQLLVIDAGSTVDNRFQAGWGSENQLLSGGLAEGIAAVGAQIDVFGGREFWHSRIRGYACLCF